MKWERQTSWQSRGTQLSAAAPWQFRAARGSEAFPWRETLAAALTDLTPLSRPLGWFQQWRVWRGPDLKPVCEFEAPPPVVADAEMLPAAGAAIDLTTWFGPPNNGRCAFAQTRVIVEHETSVRLHIGADWWTQWWLDDRCILSTIKTGNRSPLRERARTVDLVLSAGEHTFTAAVISGNGGWGLAAEAQLPAADLTAPAGCRIEARKSFHVTAPRSLASLTFLGAEPQRCTLNGRPVGAFPAGLVSLRIAGLDAGMLREGENELQLTWSGEEVACGVRGATLGVFAASQDALKLVPRAELIGLTPADVELEFGPVLGHITEGSASLACRTNLPAEVSWSAGGITATSGRGLVHHLRLTGLPAGQRHDYELVARVQSQEAPLKRADFATLPASGALRLAVTADCGPLPKVWGEVSERILAERPHLCVFVGDMVSAGRREQDWGPEFLYPAANLVARVPLYPVLGNHDEASSLFEEHFITPAGRNWSQLIGSTLLLAVDGTNDWTPGSSPRGWLENELAQTPAQFILAFSHYPAWSSGPHLRAGADGQLAEPNCRAARHELLPLWQRYGVTAVFSGHDHFYERSLLPGGLTMIVCGGAGAFLYERGDKKEQNPYSQVFASVHHYCLLDLAADSCRLVARSVRGDELDRVEFAPRKL
jgi:hypothetical protein